MICTDLHQRNRNTAMTATAARTRMTMTTATAAAVALPPPPPLGAEVKGRKVTVLLRTFCDGQLTCNSHGEKLTG